MTIYYTAGLPDPVPKCLALFGQRLSAFREQRGWSQERLASVAGIHLPDVQAVENGDPKVAIGCYAAILWALDLDRDIDLWATGAPAGTSTSQGIDTNF
ncbi:hypothetical protein D3C72_2277990 [compost metagenome]